MTTKKIELLSPAKNLECGRAAITCGADAVYIGAPKFGARAGAGNELEDIRSLIAYAHIFHAKVYVTVNTILYENELDEARELIRRLSEMGADAIIFQDMGLLEMDIPPIPLHASTQTHNYEPVRVKFLDALGIPRVILARELTIDDIRALRGETQAELEYFIHGALCVSLSGQCYMSHELSGRSANRGECAQNCRLPYSLIDRNGKVIVADKHLLSLRDLNLSAHIKELIDAGITSFKIEGRYKDIDYVKNITAFYRQAIDTVLANDKDLRRASSGYSVIPFTPDPEKTFNRGYTEYFLHDRTAHVGAHDSPKSTGKYLGRVTAATQDSFTIAAVEPLVNGDGICYLDAHGELTGMNVSGVRGNTVFTGAPHTLTDGTKIYRNHDHAFEKELARECSRKIRAAVTVSADERGTVLSARDEDGIVVELLVECDEVPAKEQARMLETFRKQLAKSGDTVFEITGVAVNLSPVPFVQVKQLNAWRRELLRALEAARVKAHTVPEWRLNRDGAASAPAHLDYSANVVNSLAERFYSERGAVTIEPGYELRKDFGGTKVMTCKYCIKDELDACPLESEKRFDEPLYLVGDNRKYRLVFNCAACLMEIVKE